MEKENLKFEIEFNIDRVQVILDSGILSHPENPLHTSALTEILILLKDLLKKSEKLGNKIAFNDDVKMNNYIKDVSDLICNFRDAACHSDSYRRVYNNSVFAFNTIVGKGILFSTQDEEIGSKYQDDIAFNMGSQILYLHRHIIRAFNELKAFFEEYFK